MTSHYFIPRAEQLESKLLMAVMHEMPTAEEFNAAPVPTSDAAAESMQVEYSNVMFSTRREGSDTLLVVHFDSTQPQRMLQIVGGEAAMTREDGTAQLRLPPAAHSVDLTIDDAMGQQIPWTRLEFSADGKILRQILLNGDSETQNPVTSSLVIASTHSNSHNAALTRLLLAGAEDWTHTATDWHDDAMSDSTVDQAMAHDYGMPASNDSAEHDASDADFAHGNATTPAQNSDDQENGAVADSEHGTSGAGQPSESAVPAQEVVAMKPVEEEFDFESFAEGWTTGELVESASVIQVVAVLPTIRRAVTIPEPAPRQTEADPVVFVSYVSTPEPLPAPVPPETGSNWPFASAMVVAAAAGAAAHWFDRRAEQLGRDVHRSN